MAKAVTSHLNYTWIEYGDPRDGQALTDGLFNMGWKNALSGFPVAKPKDALGLRSIDAAHLLLPIRWKGSTLMILPNETEDTHSFGSGPRPPVKDPIFLEFRKANGDPAFKEEIQKQNEFIAEWVFCPGINKVSDTECNLTIDDEITDYVDMIGISGHGANGSVFGGESPAFLKEPLLHPRTPASDRLKYVIIASCQNVADVMTKSWMPAFRRDRPIHGILGYGDGYFGDDIGGQTFQNFTTNLKAGGGSTNTILGAWRKAHSGALSKYWAALAHVSSAKNDTMAKWLAGEIETPDATDEVRWFNEANFPDGIVVPVVPPPFTVNFFIESTEITEANTNHPDVGLFPGKKGSLKIVKTTGSINKDEKFTITFFLFRPTRPGMNLDTLLTFDPQNVSDFKKIKDYNKRDGNSTFVDAVEFVVTDTDETEVTLPFTVRDDALDKYPAVAQGHGFFYVQLELESAMDKFSYYDQGVWLREPAKP